MPATPRAERVAQVLALIIDEGLTARHVANRLGVSYQTVRELLSDPDGSKARERRQRYQGVCADCGGPTDGSRGFAKAPARCRYCVRGGAPRQRQPDRRRRIPVRLTEIPLERRVEAAHESCRIERGDWERQAILMAAIAPSENVYWVAA